MRTSFVATAIAVAISVTGCGQPQTSTTESSAATSTAATAASSAEVKVNYPVTTTAPVSEQYFGTTVVDNYRWLEDDRSEQTAAWVTAQNQVTFDYLQQIPYREKLKQRLTELMNYEKVGAPFTEGEYTYFYRNDGLQNQSVLYRQKSGGEVEVFLDPNGFSADGTTSLAGVDFSEDGNLAAYQISEGGSDWRKVIVIDVHTKQPVEPTLVDIKFSNIAWLGNQGFFYSSYDKPQGSELSAKTDQHKLYYHQLGSKQADDKLIFGGSEAQKHRYVGAAVTDDNRYLVISAATSTSGNKLFVKDLSQPDAPLQTVLDHTDSDTDVIDNQGSTLIAVTNLNAPNKRVVKIDLAKPQAEHWQDLIAETSNVLSVSTGGGYIFAKYMVDAISKVEQYDLTGKKLRDITLPGAGSAGGFSGKKQDKTLYYSFTNYSTPGSIYALNADDGSATLYRKTQVAFNSDDYESKQVFYRSKDGTKVPMIITFKKGTELNGQNPTMLYGYGGFNVSMTPNFSSTIAAWLEQGGVYAVANLRGGGEYGKAWHDAGTKLQKQNVFDDFIAAAEFLVAERYTNPGKLAIRGGSNGGLLVGATMLQRPDLFKVALPAVGVLDMLRYHTFTAGAGWAYDYGTAQDNKAMFDYLHGYSPVHNVKANVQYPATLITTGDHDDRVVPAHSFKFAAELQAKQQGSNPTLIRIETNAGHGAGTPTSKIIEQYADIYSFTLYNMGYKTL